ncbi:serine hydrolase domain-containing protein [Microlunatus parietis]|uniref:CubicO group peptidase (Beta-lactamase class C family) n=1 Tax=Microlunatus parietis TaxID=682979 RepID=A0A7Y9I9J6_9ACTN|nr:serine hydrolase domain-containing protein [Microlunatus parietis]NYE72471.1 CubicO group peptidase (beta-lactamase class C family) [Microlunatus parietis]
MNPEAKVRELAERAVRNGHVGVVAGVVEDDRLVIAGAGRVGGSGAGIPDRLTSFRIASVTKPITATLLARAVVRGEVGLDRPIRELLPEWELPADPYETITLEHLATHRAGLPHGLQDHPTAQAASATLPRTVRLGPERGPLDLAGYVSGLVGLRPSTPPGTQYAYSNLGAQLIGMALTGGTRQPFGTLLREGLGMIPGTAGIVDQLAGAGLAPGHDTAGAPCATPDYPLGVASGGLIASAEALLNLVRAHWAGTGDADTDSALRLTTTPRADAFGDNRIGLLWHIGPVPDGDGLNGIWHNGSLPGYRSFLGFRPDARLGAVVLSNTSKSVDHLGAELLRP